MEKIILVEKWKKQAYRVTFESGEKLYVSEDLLVNEQLLKEKEFTEQAFAQLKEKVQIDRGYQLALNYLSYQMRSKKEIKDYLKKHEIESAYFSAILTKLIEVNLVDDQAYADSYVRTMIKTSDKGPKVIFQQLKKKGIHDENIRQSLTIFTEKELFTKAKQLAEKLTYKYRNSSSREMEQKIRYQLMNKGFDVDTIKAVMETIDFQKEAEDEFDLLCEAAKRYVKKSRHAPAEKRVMMIKQGLFRKGYPYDLIQKYIDEKLDEEDFNE